jgi:hypothetical protein
MAVQQINAIMDHRARHGRGRRRFVRDTSKVEEMDESKIDREAMGRLAKALTFICGPKHAATLALQAAADSGTERDIKAARTLFLRLKPGERKAAMAMLED